MYIGSMEPNSLFKYTWTHLPNHIYKRVSVDSLCRDGTNTTCDPELPNMAFTGSFRHIQVLYECFCTR